MGLPPSGWGTEEDSASPGVEKGLQAPQRGAARSEENTLTRLGFGLFYPHSRPLSAVLAHLYFHMNLLALSMAENHHLYLFQPLKAVYFTFSTKIAGITTAGKGLMRWGQWQLPPKACCPPQLLCPRSFLLSRPLCFIGINKHLTLINQPNAHCVFLFIAPPLNSVGNQSLQLSLIDHSVSACSCLMSITEINLNFIIGPVSPFNYNRFACACAILSIKLYIRVCVGVYIVYIDI